MWVPPAPLVGLDPRGTAYGVPSRLGGIAAGPPGQRAGECGQHWEAGAAPEQPSLMCLLVADFLPSLPVHFRYVVFHPFLDEILIGKIKGCSPEGVHGNGGPSSSHEAWEHVGASGQASRPPFSFCARPHGQGRGQIQKQKALSCQGSW